MPGLSQVPHRCVDGALGVAGDAGDSVDGAIDHYRWTGHDHTFEIGFAHRRREEHQTIDDTGQSGDGLFSRGMLVGRLENQQIIAAFVQGIA